MNLTKILTAAAISFAMAVPAAQAATVNATVSPAAITVGGSFTIELATDSVTPDFVAFQTPLSWEGTALNLTGITYNAGFDLTDPGSGPFSSPLNVAAAIIGPLAPPLSGMQTLATFTFSALAAGSTVVTFGQTGLDGGFLTGTDGDSLFDGPVTASVNIDAVSTDPNVVPLPASLLLLLGGLFGLGMFGRKRV